MQPKRRVTRTLYDFLGAGALPLLRNKAVVLVLSLVTLAVFAWLEYLGQHNLSMTTLYLIPIAVAAWYVGARAGLAAAMFAGAAQMIVQLAAPLPSPVWFAVWNAAGIIVLSMLVVEVLVRLHASLERERDLARTDKLTGLPNVRAFEEIAQAEIERNRRYGHPFTLAVLDLDHFKSVNDALGHQAGDRLLADVASALRLTLRRTDAVARIGGDEFAILMPETDEEQADVALGHVQLALKLTTDAAGHEVRASIGAVTYRGTPGSVAEMLRVADSAMYRAKETGRDAIETLTLPMQATEWTAGVALAD